MRLLPLLLCLPLPAQAVPILYDIEFATRTGDQLGSGVFVWHDDTQRISNFLWDIDGRVGGFNDSLWASGLESNSTFMFEVMTGKDVDPTISCDPLRGIENNCRWGGTGSDALWGWPTYDGGYLAEFVRQSDNSGLFLFAGLLSERPIGGSFTTTPRHATSVPEPEMFGLLALGGLAAYLGRRKKTPRPGRT